MKLKTCALTVLYNTPLEEVTRLQKQWSDLGVELFTIDNTGSGAGFAVGINALLQDALSKYDVLFISNPDIDISSLHKKTFLDAANHFDIWGYTMIQEETVYYGGEIDKLRMSGGLTIEKPSKRFMNCDFVSGSLMAVGKKVFEKCGMLDTSYGMYYEDVEFCLRARKQVFTVGIDCENSYLHFEDSKTNSQKNKWLAKNRMKFLWQHGNTAQKLYEIIRLPKTLLEDGKHLI